MCMSVEKEEAGRAGACFLCWAVGSVHQTDPAGASTISPSCSTGGNGSPVQPRASGVGDTHTKNVLFH